MTVNSSAVRILREKDGWTATAFADHLGISLQYLLDIESGKRKLKRNPRLIREIAQALNVPTSMVQVTVPGEEVA